MKLTSRNLSALGSLAIAVTVALVLAAMVLASPLLLDRAQAQSVAEQAVEDTSKEGESAAKPKPKKAPPPGPADDFDRGVPRTTVLGYFKAARDGDFERAAHYLDLRRFPESVRQSQGLVLARQLKIVLDRVGLWIDLDLVSNDPGGHVDDGLPPHQDSLGRIKTPEKTLDILLQRVRRQDGVKIWKFSTSTVAEIPNLYSEFGYRPFEESLLQIFPDVTFLGWQSWQWALYLALLALAFVAVLVPTWLIGWLLRRKDTDMSRQIARFVTRPLLITLWLVLDRVVGKYLGESGTV